MQKVMRLMVVALAVSAFLLSALRGSVQAQTPSDSPGQHAADILKEGMADSNPVKRKQVVVGMSLASANTAATPLLRAALTDRDVEVRIAACASLSEMKDRTSIPDLKKALNDDAPEVGFAAARALLAMDDPEGEAVILDILAKERKTSSNIITRKKREAIRMLEDRPGLLKLALKQGIGMAPIPGLGFGMSSLEDLLSNSGVSGRALAALLLAQEKDADSLEALREALTDSDWGVRAAAVHSLALREQPQVLGDLVPLLDDKKPDVRYRAAAAYLRLTLLKSKGKPRKKRRRGRVR